MVAPRRIRAATQPPIEVIVRNTTGARTTYVIGRGATNLEMVESAANSSILMTMYTPIAVLMLISQSRLRSADPTIDGTERQACPQNHRDAASDEADSARRVYSSIRSPSIASRYGTGMTDSRNQHAKAGGDLRLICPPSGSLAQPSCCEWSAPILEGPVCRQPRRETAFSPGRTAPGTARRGMGWRIPSLRAGPK